ncbi:MAG TPA: hypothetical protein VFB81_20810, partial [Myxococcales bacterium]|nr:hypothetical protein [Myxococcales bacterium]
MSGPAGAVMSETSVRSPGPGTSTPAPANAPAPAPAPQPKPATAPAQKPESSFDARPPTPAEPPKPARPLTPAEVRIKEDAAKRTPAEFAQLAAKVDKDPYGRAVLAEGIRQGRPGAREAVRGLLNSTAGDSKWLERSREAALIFSETRSHLGKEDLDALRECASRLGHEPAGYLASRALDPFACDDPAARDAAMKQLADGAAKGDKKSLQTLTGFLRDSRWYPDDVRRDAVAVLSDNRNMLGKDEWASLAARAGEEVVGPAVSQILQESARAGNEHALDGMAKIATTHREPYMQRWATDVLADAGKHLQPRHYDALASRALSSFEDSPARRALVFALREGREGAADAAKKALKAQGVDASALDGKGLANKLEEGAKQAERYRMATLGRLTPEPENRRVLVDAIRAGDPAALAAVRAAARDSDLKIVKDAVGVMSEVRSQLSPDDVKRLEGLSKLEFSMQYVNSREWSTLRDLAKAALNPLTSLDPKARAQALDEL